MLTDYGIPLLLRLHRYVCAWMVLLTGECHCNTPGETPCQELRSTDSVRATVSL